MCLNKTQQKKKNRNIGGLGVANFKNLFSFEEIANFRDFQVFDFSPYTKFENSKTQKYCPDL